MEVPKLALPLTLLLAGAGLAFLMVFGLGDGEREGYFPPALIAVRWQCPPSPGPESESYGYWGTLGLDRHRATWYADVLRAAHEPQLYSGSIKAKGRSRAVWRFMWLRSFHAPVVVRVNELADGSLTVTAYRRGEDVPDLQKPEAMRKVRHLSPAEAVAFRQSVTRSGLTSAPPFVCRAGVDGSNWVFEAIDATGYHFADRWSPDDRQTREAGLAFLKLTGWRFDPIY